LVRSALVVPLTDPPIAWSGPKYSSSWWALPWNIRCSKRWAKPDRPAGSSLEPTPYQTFTCTSGRSWSGAMITWSPLSRENASKGTETSIAVAAGSQRSQGAIPTVATCG